MTTVMTDPEADQDLWVFGYGSLLWSPCFTPAEQHIARLDGYHRSFCMWSIHHRGTVADPGLVLALDRAEAGHCEGVAFRVPVQGRAAALTELRERELISSAYYEAWLPVTLTSGEQVKAVTYVIDPTHVQYAIDLSLSRQAEVIANAVGGKGPNHEYLDNTWQHLCAVGLHDPDMQWLVDTVARLRAV